MSNLIGTSPQQVPTNGQLGTLAFQDTVAVLNPTSLVAGLGYTPANKAGDTFTGAVNLPASTSSIVPLHIEPGTTPASISNGDVWVESTGLFAKNNTFTHQLDIDTNSSGVLGKTVITVTGAGSTISCTSVEAFLYSTATFSGNFKKFVIPAATGLALTDNTSNYLIVNYNSGSPVFQITTDVTAINGSNIAGAALLYRAGTEVHFQPVDWGLAPASRTNRRLIQTKRFERASGLALGETTGNVITVSGGVIWYGVAEYAKPSVTSASSNAEQWVHVAGVWTKTLVSTYNNTQYDNGTDVVTVGGGKAVVNWVYRYLDGDSLPKLAYVLGQDEYSIAQAQASTMPTPPPILSQMAVLVGRIIVVKSAATATQIDSAFTIAFAGSSVTDHNDLANLQGGAADEYFHLTSAEYTGTGTGTVVKALAPTITGLKETKVAMAANAIDLTLANYFTKTISGATTLTVSNVPATGIAASFILDLTNGGSAVITWFSGVKWAGGTAPTLTTAGRDSIGFFTHDGGTTWSGLVLGKDIK